jgi:hypothetical protein
MGKKKQRPAAVAPIIKSTQLQDLEIKSLPKVSTSDHKLVGAAKAVGSLETIGVKQVVGLFNLGSNILNRTDCFEEKQFDESIVANELYLN